MSILTLRFWGLAALSAGVLCLWCVSAVSNFAHGLQLAGSSEWAYVIGAASVGADILKVAAVVGVLAALRQRLWLVAVACLVIWLTTTGWAVKSGLSFISTLSLDTVAAREHRGTILTTDSAAVADMALVIRALSAQSIAAAAQSTVATTRTKVAAEAEAQRAQAMLEAAERRQALLQVRLQSHHAVVTEDPLAAMLRKAGIPTDMTMLGSALLFLLLLEVGSNLSVAAFAHLYRGSFAPDATADAEPDEENEGSHVANGVTERIYLAVNNDTVAGEARRAPSARSAHRLHTEEFLVHMVASHGGGASIAKRRIYPLYQEWCRSQGVEAFVKANTLFQCLGLCGMTQIRANGVETCVLPKIAAAA